MLLNTDSGKTISSFWISACWKGEVGVDIHGVCCVHTSPLRQLLVCKRVFKTLPKYTGCLPVTLKWCWSWKGLFLLLWLCCTAQYLQNWLFWARSFTWQLEMSKHKFPAHFSTHFIMESPPVAFWTESLLVVAASVFPQICQAIFAEIRYLSSSICKSPRTWCCFWVCTQQPCAVCAIVLVSWTISCCPEKCGLACVTVRGGRRKFQVSWEEGN